MTIILIGIIPLLIYVLDYVMRINQNLFFISSFFTGLGFIIIAWLKTYDTQSPRWKGILETLMLGALAATVSYFVGDFLEHLLTVQITNGGHAFTPYNI